MNWQRCTKYLVILRTVMLKLHVYTIYGYSSVLSPEVDESTIQLPSLLLVVGAVSLPLKCEYFL